MMRTWKSIALTFTLIVLLGGCSQSIRAVKLGIQTDAEFNETVLADAQNAGLLAAAMNDTLALKCWVYVEAFALANRSDADTPAGEVVGVLSAYQQARNVRRMMTKTEISDQFRLECGPMLIESAGALGRLGLRIAL